MSYRRPVQHFAFTKLVVADLEAGEAFYTSVFGLELEIVQMLEER